MVLWSVEVIHFTKFLPLADGATEAASMVGRSA